MRIRQNVGHVASTACVEFLLVAWLAVMSKSDSVAARRALDEVAVERVAAPVAANKVSPDTLCAQEAIVLPLAVAHEHGTLAHAVWGICPRVSTSKQRLEQLCPCLFPA